MNTTTTKSHHTIDLCNKMLQDERSAVTSYQRVIRKFQGEPGIDQVATLLHDHKLAVHDLELEVLHIGGEPTRETHSWKRILWMIQNSVDLLGDDSAVEALRKVEKTILKDYRRSLRDENFLRECRHLCSARLLPLTESHLDALEVLEKTSGHLFIPVY